MPDADDPSQERPRKRKPAGFRRVRTVVLCLIAGAVINVLVAWECALDSPLRSCLPIVLADAKPLFDAHSIGRDSGSVTWRRERGLPDQLGIFAEESRGLGRRDVLFYDELWGESNKSVPNRLTVGFVRQAGWPLWSVKGSTRSGLIGLGELRSEVTYKSWASTEYIRVNPTLPYHPMPIGFVVNTLLYAASLMFLISVPEMVKRICRTRPGHCPACAYDLRGAKHEVCPEYGKAVG